MSFNYEYPYTDPHRYNSDWLLHKVEALPDELLAHLPEVFQRLEESAFYRYNPAMDFSSFRRVYRQLYKSFEHDNTVSGRDKYCQVQGGCVFTHDGVKYVSYVLVDGTNTDNTSRLIVKNIETGTALIDLLYEFCHGNSIAYHDGYLYIAPYGVVVDGAIQYTSKDIIRVSLADQQILKTTYEVSNIAALSFWDDDLYIFDSIERKLYRVGNYELYEIFTLPPTAGLFQDFAMFGNKAYFMDVSPNTLMCADLTTGVIAYSNPIPKTFDRIHLSGEPEGITIDPDGTCYIVSNVRLGDHTHFIYNMSAVYIGNIDSNNNALRGFTYQHHSGTLMQIYIRENGGINPDGTYDNAVTSFAEALEIVHAMDEITDFQINVRMNVDDFGVLNCSKNVFITGGSSGNMNIGGIYSAGCNLSLAHVNVVGKIDNVSLNGALHLSNSVVNISQTTYDPVSMPHGVYIYNTVYGEAAQESDNDFLSRTGKTQFTRGGGCVVERTGA